MPNTHASQASKGNHTASSHLPHSLIITLTALPHALPHHTYGTPRTLPPLPHHSSSQAKASAHSQRSLSSLPLLPPSQHSLSALPLITASPHSLLAKPRSNPARSTAVPLHSTVRKKDTDSPTRTPELNPAETPTNPCSLHLAQLRSQQLRAQQLRSQQLRRQPRS